MSAIAGIFNLDGAPADAGLLHAMTDVVRHRGPDGIGHWVQGPVGLGHLQLVTTPEARNERQPLVSEDGKFVLVWDGRLDNREALADALRTRRPLGHLTDADLVMEAYVKWGQQAPAHLIGDFAFALWDAVRQELFCARDPIGVRVFHYHYDGKRFLFGTEIKEIFQDVSVPQTLNETMLGLALCSSWGDATMTFYESVKRLPGGFALTVSRRGLQTRVFWNPDPNDTVEYPRRESYAEHFREIVVEAVRCRLRGSTGVEIQLSGGVDSGAIASVAGLLRENGNAPTARITALTCVYGYAELDESPYVRAVSERYDMPVKWVPVDDRWAMKRMPESPKQDEPYELHFEGIQHAALQSARQRGVRVLLTGEGGDETSMYGYMLHTRDWFRRFRWRSIVQDLSGSTPAYRRAALAAIRHALVPGFVQRMHGRDASSIPTWVRQEFIRRSGLRTALWDVEPRTRKESLYLQMRGRLPLFLGSDIRGAAFGTELRHPLWDARVVEFLSRIPPAVRFEGGREKLLLRRAMAGILPEEVRRRAGHGAFGTLVDRGLREEETERIRGVLSTSLLDSMGVIDARRLRERFGAYVAGDEAKRARVMPTLLVEDWLRTRALAMNGVESELVSSGAVGEAV